MSNSYKPLESLTKLEQERQIKKQVGEEGELIDQMGQRSDLKAKSVIQYYMKTLENIEQKAKDEALEILEGLKKKDNQKYNDFLAVATQRFISQEDLPRSMQPRVRVKANKIGIIISIMGTDYYTAFKSSYMPLYDYVACKISVTKLGNTISKLMGGQHQTPGGILIADSEQLKQYGRNN